MNATGFVRDFGLMPKLIADMGLGPLAQSVLMGKLGMIHAAVVRMMEREAKREAERGV